MTSETLETLLIDRALGQLSPEMEALLAEHLATDAESTRIAAELRDTIALATRALLRPAPALELPPPVARPFQPQRLRPLFALAASFLAGAGLTFFALRSAAPRLDSPQRLTHQGSRQPSPAAGSPIVSSPEVQRAVRSLPFWSKQRVYLVAQSKETQRQVISQ